MCVYMCILCVCMLIIYNYIDYDRLAERGYKVVGVELSEVAVKRFFTEHQLEHKVVTASNGTTVYEVIMWAPYLNVKILLGLLLELVLG